MVHRIEIWPKLGMPDVRGAAAQREAASLGLTQAPRQIVASSVYLIEGELNPTQIARLADELLADPLTEAATIGASPGKASALIEVHPLPGVMDPDAEAVQLAIKSMLGKDVTVRTGRRYDMHDVDRATAHAIAERALANTVIHAIHDRPYHPSQFPHGSPYELKIVAVPLLELDDMALLKLSREAHLFLNLDEMKTIQAEYRRLGRNPREIELETLAQTWSEHCVHKTLKATIRYRQETSDAQSRGIAIPRRQRPGHQLNPDGSITIPNLLKSTIAAATHELIGDGIDWCLSVFVDNSGVIAFDDEHAVCFKVETHNHPSAIEPYGGAATGIGGCIRDVIGTGLAAKPIAATDVFCVAHPDHWDELPSGVLHPRRVLTQVVAGVRDYGNRMGIPTLNGAVWFDDDYVGNPLVFCGVVGVMPRDKIRGTPQRGDRIIAVGGRTGRDGIHGATFSSAELTGTHADEFAHAVQIGNAVTEKMVLDAVIEARDSRQGCLFSAITDCGAGGFSSAVGEMGKELGAEVHLDRAPLKYEGLSPTEIWISEAQERMVLAVPPANVDDLRAICDANDVEMCDLGHFGTDSGELILNYRGVEVGRLSMKFLHEGLPETVREAVWTPASRGLGPRRTSELTEAPAPRRSAGLTQPGSLEDALVALLSHPNIASKRWIIRQYDHEVQGGTVVKPLVGPLPQGEGPSDAAVITPVSSSTRGLAIANGLATGLRDDPYLMALAAVDECVRNLVCVGADPRKIAILDNFCWPSCNDPRNLGALVRAAEGCYDAAIAYRTPFVSGKDSLNNQFTTEDGRTIQIPYTLLISGMGIVEDVRQCVTMDAKAAGNLLVIVGWTFGDIRASHYARMFGIDEEPLSPLPELGPFPSVDLQLGPQSAREVHELIKRGLVQAAHDCSDGGLLVAAAEMAMAGGLGLDIEIKFSDYPYVPIESTALSNVCFSEEPSRYLLEIQPNDWHEVQRILSKADHYGSAVIGQFNSTGRLKVRDDLDGAAIDAHIDDLQQAWTRTLDW